MKEILIFDIECFLECFFIGIYIPEENKNYEFSINRWENQLYSLIKFIDSHKDYYWTGYNNLKYDSQIIEWILRNYTEWVEISNLEICSLISRESNLNIENSNYGLFARYKEGDLFAKQIDLPCIWHFFNENRKISLKLLEFEMRMENIEELPFHFLTKDLTREQIKDLKDYCFNDIAATYEFYKYTVGDTEHPLYKNQNKILDRDIIKEETGLECLNWDDVKIGAEWNKLDYMKITGKNEKQLKPVKVNHFYGKKYKYFFPKTVQFKTKKLLSFIKELGETFVLNKKQEFNFKFNDELSITIGKGGIHSNEKPRLIKPEKDQKYYQCDIGSQYPNFIRKAKIYPSHLGIEWNEMIQSKIERRLKYKKLAKETKDRRYESLQEMGKLSLNGGSFGRLNTQGDWQEDPCAMLKVTLGCQMEILMIIEGLIESGFRIISANTDGFDAIIDNSRDVEFKSMLSEYEKKIGNDIMGNFEITEFEWIAQMSVNGYIAKKTEKGVKDNGIKKKKEFLTDYELWKNSSGKIIPIALEKYYVDNIPIEQTIRNHDNLYDFCIRQKSTKDFHYEGVKKDKTNIYKKLIRYYVSTNGEKLLKVKNPECTTNANPISQVEAGEWLSTVCNHLPSKTIPNNIDYKYYIERCQTIIDKIKLEGRKKIKEQPKNQLNIF